MWTCIVKLEEKRLINNCDEQDVNTDKPFGDIRLNNTHETGNLLITFTVLEDLSRISLSKSNRHIELLVNN